MDTDRTVEPGPPDQGASIRQITIEPSFVSWQRSARTLVSDHVPPALIVWHELGADQPALDLFDEAETSSATARFHVSRRFVEMARLIALHKDTSRWALLYRLLWRLTHGEPRLLDVFVEPDVGQAFEMEKSVRKDIHKMRAFVRFREVKDANEKRFVAWFEPAHQIVEHNAAFFADRFGSTRWSILTPIRCAHWDGLQLSFTEGLDRSAAGAVDDVEALWLTYYANIFNPARVKVHAMEAEMPKKYWRNLPEAAVIPQLIREASPRVQSMLKKSATKVPEADEEWHPAPVPQTTSLKELASAAKSCTSCHLYKRGTQTVFGEGRKQASLMFLGEQPGDQEDLAGKPFVGPAGKLLDRALEEAGIDRDEVYVTNTVKHFKWEPRGKRRIHQKPNSREIAACRPWLEAELRVVKPKLLVCLGSTAGQAIFGPSFRVTKERGKVLESPFAPKVVATVHPSSLLRQPDEESRQREYALFLADLHVAKQALAHT